MPGNSGNPYQSSEFDNGGERNRTDEKVCIGALNSLATTGVEKLSGQFIVLMPKY